MCSESTFIQIHTDWQKYRHVLQCSLTELYTYSQIYSFAEYLFDGLPIYAPIRPLLRTGLCTWSGLTDRSLPIRFSTCIADPANVEVVSQQCFKYPFSLCVGDRASTRHATAEVRCACTDVPGMPKVLPFPATQCRALNRKRTHLKVLWTADPRSCSLTESCRVHGVLGACGASLKQKSPNR